MPHAPRRVWLVLAAVLVACGGTERPSVTEDPAASADGLLTGVPGNCRLLEDHDPALHTDMLEIIVPSVDHGPLVIAVGDAGEVIGTTTYESPGVQGASAAWTLEDDTVVAVNPEAERISSAPRATSSPPTAQVEDCSWVAADRSVADPPEPEPEMRPDLMLIEPPAAPPGSEVALRFPEETFRGIAFQLDRRTADGWETTHWMTSDANGDQYADTVPAGTEGYGVIDVGVGGPGPDHVRLPDDVGPGEHRICTANAGEEFCAPLTITDG